jgi:hypothetical protein
MKDYDFAYLFSEQRMQACTVSKADSECVNWSISVFSISSITPTPRASPGSIGPTDAPDGHAMHPRVNRICLLKEN